MPVLQIGAGRVTAGGRAAGRPVRGRGGPDIAHIARGHQAMTVLLTGRLL